MNHRPTGPACGNNPNHPITDGDRQAVEWFKTYLEQRADGRGDIVRRRKRPVEVHTIQWTGDNEQAVQAFTGGPSVFYALDDADRENCDDPEATATVYDKLHSTWVLVYTGQHIVRGVKGEFYPIAEDVLAETYEPVDAAPAVVEPPADQTALLGAAAQAIREFPFDNFGLDDVSYLLDSTPETQEWVPKLAAAVLAVLPAHADRAALERVRAMHQPTEGLGYGSDEDGAPGSYGVIAQVCTTCGTPDEYGIRWPCATFTAVDTEARQDGAQP